MASKARLSVLKNRSDFLFILKNGQRVRPCDWLLMNFVLNQDEIMRCGWTLPRNVGSAVIRNRLKRWSREYFRAKLRAGETLPINLNLVFRKTDKDFYKKLDYGRFSEILDRGWQQLQRRIQSTSSSAHRDVPHNRNNTSRGRMPV